MCVFVCTRVSFFSLVNWNWEGGKEGREGERDIISSQSTASQQKRVLKLLVLEGERETVGGPMAAQRHLRDLAQVNTTHNTHTTASFTEGGGRRRRRRREGSASADE